MRKLNVALLGLVLLLAGCSPDVTKVGDDIGKFVNAAVPLKTVAFIPGVLKMLGPIFDALSIVALIAFVTLALSVLFGPKEGQGNEVTRGLVFISGKVVLALIVVLADLFGRALWPDALTVVGVITKLGWGWPLKADVDPMTTALAFFTLTFFSYWHVGVQIFWTLYTVYGVIVGGWTRNTESLQRALVGLAFWAFSAFVWWHVVINIIGSVVSAGNFLTSSLAHVNWIFILLTWGLMVVSVTEPFRMDLTRHVVPETMRVRASGKFEELLEALVAGFVGAKVSQQGSGEPPRGASVVYGPDPQARLKLAPPREPRVASADDTSPSPRSGGDGDGTNPPGTTDSGTLSSPTQGPGGVRVSTRTARSQSTARDGDPGASSVSQTSAVSPSTSEPPTVKTRSAKEDVTARSNGQVVTASSNGVRVVSVRRPREDKDDQPRDAGVVWNDGRDVTDRPSVSTRDAQVDGQVLDTEAESAESLTPVLVDNGDDGRALYYATEDVPDELGMPLIPAGSMIVPDEVPNAVSDAGVISYGKLIPWDKIRKVELREAEDA